ncbi:MAG: FecR family protein [Candidatus Omnitrophota bacterium]
MKKIMAVLFLLSLAFAVSSPTAYAQTEEFALMTDQAVILDLEGEVEAKLSPSGGWIEAQVGMELKGSSELKTGAGSWAEVGFETGYGNENVIRLQGGSSLIITSAAPVRLNLIHGELRALVQGLSAGSTFEVKTPTAVCGARGTGWDTITDGKKSMVDTFEDNVFFSPLGGPGEKTINKGKRGVLEDPKGIIDIRDLPAGKMKDWSRWKTDMSERTGIKTGIRGKVEKTRAVERLINEKERAVERKSLDKKREAIESKSKDGDPYP